MFYCSVPSMRDHGGARDFCSRRQPRVVGLEFDAKLVVVDAEITVAALRDGLRHHGLHFLRHYADIGSIAAVVGETIETKTVIEAAEQHDVVLEPNVGATSSATPRPPPPPPP